QARAFAAVHRRERAPGHPRYAMVAAQPQVAVGIVEQPEYAAAAQAVRGTVPAPAAVAMVEYAAVAGHPGAALGIVEEVEGRLRRETLVRAQHHQVSVGFAPGHA